MPTIEVSEQTYQTLQQMAQATQQTAADLISALLPSPRREYTREEIEVADDELFSHTVHAPYAVGSDNESIDADLIREHGGNDEPPPAPIHKNVGGVPLQEYQAFIDGLLEWPRVSVRARWVREWGNKPPGSTYQTPADFDARIRPFTAEQRQVIADFMQEEHEGGIGTFLAYLEK